MKEKICVSCGYIGQPTTQGMGSFFVDLIIWMVITSFTLFTAFLPLLLIPLSWTIFHIATYKTITCPKCENLDMVSMTSTKGKRALKLKHDKHEPAPHHTHASYAK